MLPLIRTLLYEVAQSDITSVSRTSIRPVFEPSDAYVSYSPALGVYVRFGDIPIVKFVPWEWGGIYYSENDETLKRWGVSNALAIGFELVPEANINFQWLADKLVQPVELIREVLSNYYVHGQGILTAEWSMNSSSLY